MERRAARKIVGYYRYANALSALRSKDGVASHFLPRGAADGKSFGASGSFSKQFSRVQGLADARRGFLYCRSLSTSTKAVSEPSRSSAVQIEEDPEEDGPAKKQDPSPEECDEAFEGLTSAKAKAQLAEESPKRVNYVQKFWSMLLGIGPALRAVASMSRADWAVKMKEWRKAFSDTLQHYWVGTKLLWADIRISARLLGKLARGKTLSRRERKQLTRTSADIFRLVPFAVFVIVPFMEFLLPVFLKLFPNMLPSTFKDKMKEQEEMKKRLNARMQYAKFLQDTVHEMARELKVKSPSRELQQTAEDLTEFLDKVRRGANVSNDDIISFAKLFNDELTLDNISRPRLVSMCKYMGIKPYGTDAYLRYSLRQKLARIKYDDRMIQKEGIDSLSEAELRSACRERGILEVSSVEDMKKQLSDWLDLSLNRSLPSSLLILSRAFASGRMKLEDTVQATILSLPDEVMESLGVDLPSEDALEERKRKLEYLESQEEFIKEEAKDEEEEQERLRKEEAASQVDRALQEMRVSSPKEALDLVKEKAKDKQDQLCKLSSALAILASASSVSKERGEFLRLVNKEIDLYNNLLKEDHIHNAEEARKAYEAARSADGKSDEEGSRISKALIQRVDSMLQKLEKEIDDVDAKIGDGWRILDRDYDGKVTPEEVAAAAAYLKDTLGDEPVQELIKKLVKDQDGKILVEDIVKLGTAADSESIFQEDRARR